MDQRIGKQGGWVGMIVLLLALVIVAYLAKDALKSYGLFAPAETVVPSRGGTAAERARATGAVDASGATVDAATPTPAAAIDKARGVGDMLKQQEGKRGGGY